MKSFLFFLLLITGISTANASPWHCWEEVDVTVCKNQKTGQLIRKSVDPAGVVTYRDNYGNRIQSYQNRYGAKSYRDAYNQEIDIFAPPVKPVYINQAPQKKVNTRKTSTQSIHSQKKVPEHKKRTTRYYTGKGEEVIVSTDVFGNTVYEDQYGNTFTKTVNVFGVEEYTDQNQNVITKEFDVFGNITYKDQFGNEIKCRKGWNGKEICDEW